VARDARTRPANDVGFAGEGPRGGAGLPRPHQPQFRGHLRPVPQDADRVSEADQGVQGPGRGEEDRHNGGVAQRGHRSLCHPEDERVRHRARGQGHLLRTAVGHVRLHHFPAR
jgi:hypothetical protein